MSLEPTKSPGRPKGSPNKIARHLKQAILLAAEEVGEPKAVVHVEDGQAVVLWKRGSGGLDGYLRWLALNEPRSYATLLGKLLPSAGVVEEEPDPRDKLSREELVEELKRRGIPVDRVFQDSLKIVNHRAKRR